MSSSRHACNLRSSRIYTSGEPFNLNAVMNIVRCSRERARQIMLDMVRNKEAVKINDDCYRKPGMNDNWLRRSWRIDESVYQLIEEAA